MLKTKADPALAHRPPPPFENFQGFIFVKFDCIYIYTQKLYGNQQAMFTRYILFSTLTTKAQGMCERASNQSPDLKNIPRWDRLPSVKKFLYPPM